MTLAPEGRGNAPTRIEPAPTELKAGAQETSDLVGQRIGNYVIEKLLGQGGMAVVYLARHPELGREVAVKLLSAAHAGDTDLNARFLQEARITANFRHPNIVEIYDLGEIGGRAYYTMERLIGVDLATLSNRRGRFSPAEVAEYLVQICGALEVAHEQGIVHRDLKPANIFIVDEQPLRLKLMDFGIAKVTQKRRFNATRYGEVLGTPAYMAPEQALGHVDAITIAADIYALGIIAYEMLAGRLPFVADSDLMLLSMQVRDAPTPLLEVAPDVPKAVAEVIERCLAKAPRGRPRCANELCVQVKHALAGAAAFPSGDSPLAAARAAVARAPASPPAPLPSQAAEAPAPRRDVGRDADFVAEPLKHPAPLELDELEIEVEYSAADGEEGAGTSTAADASAARSPAPPEMAPGIHEPVSEPAPAPVGRDFAPDWTDDATGANPIALTNDDGRVLDRLLRRMQHRVDFPSFLANVTEISVKADADLDYSAWQLSEAILKDFALTAKLLRMVNSLYASRFGGKVFSVNQAVMILGFDSVRSMALGIILYKTAGQTALNGAGKGNPPSDDLADEAIRSLVAGEIARQLAPKCGIKDAELAMMSAMFRNLGQQLVMEYLPEEYTRIVALAESARIPRSVAAQRVLGTTLAKIGIGVAERWQLPRPMRLAMASNPGPDLPLVREQDRLSALAKLANALCDVVASGARQDYKPAMQRLLISHRRLLTLDDRETTALLGTVCKSFETRYSALFGPYHRKSRFLIAARALAGEAPQADQPVAEPLTAGDVARIEQAVSALKDGLQQRRPAEALLAQAMQALATGLRAQRALLLTATADRKELEVRHAVGDETGTLKTQLRLPIGQGGDIFSSALRDGKHVVVEDALSHGVMRRLPRRYFEVLGSAAFALYVCLARGYPNCLVLVDAESPEALPRRDRVKATQPLRKLIAKLAERK